ncbi:MAG TPA: outer membrane protein transport protein [Acidiferrobacterales bacterium]
MKRIEIFRRSALALTVVAAAPAQAVNGFQMIGFGEHQVALGGAVTANPASAMTALTNPAGLTRVGERADFSLEAFMPDVSLDAGASAFGAGRRVDSSGDFYGIPSIGWVGRTGNERLFFGGGMYATAGLGADYGTVRLNGGGTTFNGYSNVGIFRISPAIGHTLSPRLSWGVAVNLNMLQLGFSETLSNAGPNDFKFDLGRAGQAIGVGATLGILYDLVPQRLTLGASYTTASNFGDTTFRLDDGDITLGGVAQPAGDYDAAFDFPQQAAIGLAWRTAGGLTLSADVKWIAYSDTLADFHITGPAGSYNLAPGWEDVTVYAIGLSYAATPRLTLMAGYNHSNAPVEADHVFANLVFPAIVTRHYTAGIDYHLGENWGLGGAVMIVPEDELTGVTDLGGADSGLTLRNGILSLGMNISYRF